MLNAQKITYLFYPIQRTPYKSLRKDANREKRRLQNRDLVKSILQARKKIEGEVRLLHIYSHQDEATVDRQEKINKQKRSMRVSEEIDNLAKEMNATVRDTEGRQLVLKQRQGLQSARVEWDAGVRKVSRQASQEIWVAKIVEEKAEKLNPE